MINTKQQIKKDVKTEKNIKTLHLKIKKLSIKRMSKHKKKLTKQRIL